MGFTVTPTSRRLAMAAMLTLAVSGGVIRDYADNPSTLRDVGTLLLVLWLPAVGNLIGYLARKIPRSAPPPTDFPAGAPFTPHLNVQLQSVELPEDFLSTLGPAVRMGTLLVGRQGFTVRTAQPMAQSLAAPGSHMVMLELLRPAAGLPHLPTGTDFHLLVGTTAVGKGCVVEG